MIIGFGSDMVDIRRIERSLGRFAERFETRVFSPGERQKATAKTGGGQKIIAGHYAKRFAAKEAFLKALGTGLAGGISWQDMEVINLPSGAPQLVVTGAALERLRQLAPGAGTPNIWLTMSDEYPFALAQVIIERPL